LLVFIVLEMITNVSLNYIQPTENQPSWYRHWQPTSVWPIVYCMGAGNSTAAMYISLRHKTCHVNIRQPTYRQHISTAHSS